MESKPATAGAGDSGGFGPRASAMDFNSWFKCRSVAGYVLAAAGVAAAGFASYFVASLWGSPRNQFDLKIYYSAVKYWVGGGNLYSYAQPDAVMGTLGFTYPPFAATLMTPMTLLSLGGARLFAVCTIVLAVVLLTWAILAQSADLRGPRGILIVGTVAAFGLTLEPLRENVTYGQVNTYLVLLVVVDLAVVSRYAPRWGGVGIGLAAAIKITPGIFVLYLIATGRWRAAGVAVGAAAAATLLSAIIAPAETWEYFLRTLWDTSRVGFPDSLFNQSINGLLARLVSPEVPNKILWIVCAAFILAFGLWRARHLFRLGDDLAGGVIVGTTGLLISPVSWTHHAVWALPTVIVLVIVISQRTKGSHPSRGGWLGSIGLASLAIAAFGWIVEPSRYVDDLIPDWSSAGWTSQLLACLPTLWMVLVVVFLPARSFDRYGEGPSTPRRSAAATAPSAPRTMPAPKP
ncbi:glycosyltransferase 87 family protein [Nakamurella antarctica]|nr:glycosyltransferase 87 family protein [Nakamurella antarctica]